MGLIQRDSLHAQYTKPYFKEVFGRRPCTASMSPSPIVIERHAGLEAMTELLTSSDQRYLREGYDVSTHCVYILVCFCMPLFHLLYFYLGDLNTLFV